MIHEHDMIQYHDNLQWTQNRSYGNDNLEHYRYTKQVMECRCDPLEYGFSCHCERRPDEFKRLKRVAAGFSLPGEMYPCTISNCCLPCGFRTVYGSLPGSDTKPPIGSDVDKNGVNANSWKRHWVKYAGDIPPIKLGSMSEEQFQRFLTYNLGTDADHTVGNYLRGRHMFLNFQGESLGDRKLQMFVQSIKQHKLNLHYLSLNGCSLTDTGIRALVDLLLMEGVELHRVECWMLDTKTSLKYRTVRDMTANVVSLPLLRELQAVSAAHPTLATWSYDYHSEDIRNLKERRRESRREWHGFPERAFYTKKDIEEDMANMNLDLSKLDIPELSEALATHSEKPTIIWEILQRNKETVMQHLEQQRQQRSVAQQQDDSNQSPVALETAEGYEEEEQSRQTKRRRKNPERTRNKNEFDDMVYY